VIKKNKILKPKNISTAEQLHSNNINFVYLGNECFFVHLQKFLLNLHK